MSIKGSGAARATPSAMSKTPSTAPNEERPPNKAEIKAVIRDALEDLYAVSTVGEGLRQDLTDEYADSKPIYKQLRIVADRVIRLGGKLEDKIDEYKQAPGVPKSVRGPLRGGQKRKDDEESGTESDSESSEDDGKPTPGGARAVRRRVT
jgi:hypothetical protein